MYRKLIQRNRTSTRTLEYQYEIVRNHSSQNAYSKDTLEEIIKLMKLVQYAEQGKFEDYSKETFKDIKTQAEQLVRQWATRYHREAQVTKSKGLYKMAYYMYKNYLETFPDSEHTYKMTFFNGEILYYLESWKRAAQAYDRALEIDDEGKWTQEAAHGQVLAYFNVINTSEERANLEDPLRFEKRDKVKEVEQGGQKEDDPVPEKKEITDLKKQLVEACKDYIEYVPDGDRIVDVKYTMARIFYEHNHLEKAVTYFEDIAFNHPDHRLGVIAANLHLDSLNLLNDFETLGKAVRRYQNEQPIDDEEFSSTVAKLDEAISFKLCRQKEDEDRWREAANCYVEFYRRFENSDYVDEALYNAALAFERIKELGKAIQVRIFLLKARPSSPYAPETLFNIGANYHALAVYSKAANFYEQFVKNFPDHEKAKEALANAATFRQGLGQYDRAISDFEKFLELFGDNPKYDQKVADVAFQIAKILEKQDKGWDALEQYREYVDNYADKGSLDRLLQAHVNIGTFFWNHDDRDQALLEFERTLEVYNDLSEEQQESLTEGRDAAAKAKFMLGEDVYQEMADITVESSSEEELQRRFKKKLKVAEKAQKIYEDVIKFRRPDWAIAALYKIGAQYQNFAETVRNSPVPERLNYNQKEIYRGLLEDRASLVESKAVDAYKRALAVAKKESWFNEYSRKAEVRLADLRPSEYRKPSELRARPTHLGAGFSDAGFIDELQEEERRLDDLGEGEPDAESVERKTPPPDPEADTSDADAPSAGGTS
jgi:tetratricopeptide (TPR) repeat protein